MSQNDSKVGSRTSNGSIAERSKERTMEKIIEIMNKVKQTRDTTEDQSNNPGGVVILENHQSASPKAMEVLSTQSEKFNTKSESLKCN